MIRRQLPNLITAFRLLLVGPIVLLILQGRYQWALGLFILAGVSDAVDGVLARRWHQQTRLGGFLDPVADKLLLAGTYVTLTIEGRLPAWLLVTVLGRDLVIGVGAAAYRLFVGPFEASPSLLSKLNTLLQLFLVLVLLLPWGVSGPSADAALGLMVAVFLTTVASGLGYVYEWGTRAAAALDGRSAHRH